jgi:type II secretory pathway component PulF
MEQLSKSMSISVVYFQMGCAAPEGHGKRKHSEVTAERLAEAEAVLRQAGIDVEAVRSRKSKKQKKEKSHKKEKHRKEKKSR